MSLKKYILVFYISLFSLINIYGQDCPVSYPFYPSYFFASDNLGMEIRIYDQLGTQINADGQGRFNIQSNTNYSIQCYAYGSSHDNITSSTRKNCITSCYIYSQCDQTPYVIMSDVTPNELNSPHGLKNFQLPKGLYSVTFSHDISNTSFVCPTRENPGISQYVNAWICVSDNAGAVNVQSVNPNVICSNTTDKLVVQYDPLSPPLSIQWQVKNSSNVWANISGATSQIYIPKYSDKGTVLRDYRAILTYQNCGVQYAYANSINVPPDVPPVTISANATMFCIGYSAVITSSVTSGYTYNWYKDNVLQPGSANSYSPSSSGNYQLTIKDQYGCTSSSGSIGITVKSPDAPIIVGLKPFYCINDDATALSGTLPGGNFTGPGIIAKTFNPQIAGKGPHTITFNGSNSPGCPTTATQKTVVLPATDKMSRVLSATAVTYSDNWPLDFNSTLGEKSAYNLNEFQNASKGIWKAEESYVYTDKRKATSNLRTDGTIDSVSLFNWNSALNGGCVPNWRKVNTITAYSPYNYELENKDILGLKSSALYGYNGKVAVAVAGNAAKDEIAYESFEEYTTGQNVDRSKLSTGNFTFFTTDPTGTFDKYMDVEVLSAIDNKITLNYPAANASNLVNKSIKLFGADIDKYATKSVYGTYTIATAEAGGDANQTLISIDATKFTYTGIWLGKASIKFNPDISFGINNAVSIASGGHTGNQSLQVKGYVYLDQIGMNLIPNKKYTISFWVSANNKDVSTFSYSTGGVGRGVSVWFFDKDNNIVLWDGSPVVDGPVIEGWQKLDWNFTMPENAVKIGVTFIGDDLDPTYIDDIRIFPFDGNMQTYVYNTINLKVNAVLDNNNYATLYYYDEQGNLYLVKKETERGIHTIQEVMGHGAESIYPGE